MLTIKVREGEKELVFKAYEAGEEANGGFRKIHARLSSDIYKNNVIFPGGLYEYLKSTFERCLTAIQPEDWSILFEPKNGSKPLPHTLMQLKSGFRRKDLTGPSKISGMITSEYLAMSSR